MKLRFGWGPTDGAEGMQRNVNLLRTVRETAGDGVDIMADAYMGWTLDYARRMVPLSALRPPVAQEPVIPDDLHGYAALKAMNRIPIAGGSARSRCTSFATCSMRRRWTTFSSLTNRVGGIDAGAQDRGARGSTRRPGRAPRRPDAQLPRRHGES